MKVYVWQNDFIAAQYNFSMYYFLENEAAYKILTWHFNGERVFIENHYLNTFCEGCMDCSRVDLIFKFTSLSRGPKVSYLVLFEGHFNCFMDNRFMGEPKSVDSKINI